MAKIYRIVDRFKITGRGLVYMIQNMPDMNLHLEDILFDLSSHRFRIKAFEMLLLQKRVDKKRNVLTVVP